MDNSKRKKVYLTGADKCGWALHDTYKLTKRAIETFCDLVPIEEAEIVHSVTWYELAAYDPDLLADKYVISHVSHDLKNMFLQPAFCKFGHLIDLFIGLTTRAKKMMTECGFNCEMVQHVVDSDVFHPIESSDARLEDMRKKYGIPGDKYLIGSFQRDAEGGQAQGHSKEEGLPRVCILGSQESSGDGEKNLL